MTREYVGRVTINGKLHQLVGHDREAVAWAVRVLTDTASGVGWEIRDTAILTRVRSSLTGRVVEQRAQTRMQAPLEVIA